MKKALYSWIILACAVWFTAGCVREDVASCRSDVEVSFRYVHNMDYADLFAQQVHKVTLFVFDANEIYLDSYMDEGAALAAPGYVMHLTLPEGNYTLLAWGGWMNTYDLDGLETGVSTLADFSLKANGRPARSGAPLDVTELDNLFHGLHGRLEVKSGQTAHAVIDLIKDTNTILVNVNGLEYLTYGIPANPDPSPFDVEITADNGLYGSDNLPLRGLLELHYLPGTNACHDHILASSTRSLRLLLGDDVRLKVTLRSSGHVICDDNLIALIAANPAYQTQQDIDREDVFSFDYQINSSATVTIKVNEWTVVDAIPLL